MISASVTTCLLMAAKMYSMPSAVLMGIRKVEGGRPGQQVKNKNGSYDLGAMQINTLWLPELAKHWRVSKRTAWIWIRDDPCVNANVAAWILKQKSDAAGSVYTGIAHYHSKTPSLGKKYRKKVLKEMRKFKRSRQVLARR